MGFAIYLPSDATFGRWRHSTLLCERMLWPPFWNYNIKSKIRRRQSVRIYFKNIPAKFHPYPIRKMTEPWNFLKWLPRQEEQQDE